MAGMTLMWRVPLHELVQLVGFSAKLLQAQVVHSLSLVGGRARGVRSVASPEKERSRRNSVLGLSSPHFVWRFSGYLRLLMPR